MVHEFWENFRHNLFKPLLLFFDMGFLVPILGVEFEFPHVFYQALTVDLLFSIGWKDGEELADLKGDMLSQAFEFMAVGFVSNLIIGIVAYLILRGSTRPRKIDAATVAGYYGSDSAGTFVTAVGVLSTLRIAHAAYTPVMLAVMEIPGCLVALFLVSRCRASGMDALGRMPDEEGYDLSAVAGPRLGDVKHGQEGEIVAPSGDGDVVASPDGPPGSSSLKLLHEVFFNPGLFLLFGGIAIGFVGRLQGQDVTSPDDSVFLGLFQGLLCLFLLEMGMTASRKLKDLRRGGWRFVPFGLVMPPIFATFGISLAHAFALATHGELQLGTYVLFAVLCASASYIAVPAVQRLAIPEASPTLPLATSLGLTFSFNVTIGIPLYLEIAKSMLSAFPRR